MAGLMAFESSCAPNAGSEGSIENMFDSGLDLSPPSPRSLSEAAPAYFLIESDPPTLNSPARFPPPPNSGLPQPFHLNMTFFEGQTAPHHSFEHPSREPRAPYDHWPERIVSSASGYGLDSNTKFVSHWPLPSASYIDNSNHGTMTAEPLYPTIATSTQHPLSDSRSEPFVPRSFSSVQDYHSTVLPSSAVPSTSCASVSSPHFSSSSPQIARPHFSSRFSFNPHASAFYPGMYSQNSYGPREDFSPYYEPSYISHLAPTDFLTNSLQGVDSFHDASSRPVHSPETAPRPISSTAPSFFSGVHSFSGSSATPSNPIVAPQHVASRTDYCGLTSSSDVSGVRESSCDFPPVSSLPFDMPFDMPVRRTSVFTPYDTTASVPPSGQLESPDLEEDDTMERILKESGTLLYHQHISPEEWRWNIYESQYEPLNVEGLLDMADCTSRRYRSTYNYFQGVDRIGPSCVNEAVGGDSNSLFALSILERSKFQNQGGPSLKLAASALAEMLATSGQSIMAHIASFPGNAPSLPMGVTLPVVGESVDALEVPRFDERLPDDCCSSSGSVAVLKEANDFSTPGGPTVNDPHDPQALCMLAENERGSADRMHVDLAKPDPSGRSQNSTTARPLTTLQFKKVPQVGTSMEFPGHRSFVSDASGGISQKISASSTGLNLENFSSENPNALSTQILDVSPDTDSGSTRRVTTQPVCAGSSEDDASVSGPLGANVTIIDPATSGPYHSVSSSRVENQVPLSAFKNFDSLRGSVMTGISPTSFQAHADPVVGAAPTVDDEVTAKLLSSFNLLDQQTLNTMQTVPLRYSSLQSLSTSISHLTKVLRATHSSSAMAQSDIAPIQESLQASILGLSECLILEQAKVNQQPLAVATDCVRPSGLKDSVGQEQVPLDNALENLQLRCPGEGQDNGGGSHRKGQSSESDQSGIWSEEVRVLYNGIDSDIRGVNIAGSRTSLGADGFQKTASSRENVDDIKKHFQVPGSAKSGGSDSTIIPGPTDTFQVQIGEVDDILDYLREQDLVDIPALKKLLAAEKREEKLKVLIQDLREQLEFQMEESRGAAYLYEKIMQEADLQTCKLKGRSMSPLGKKVGGSSETLSNLRTTSLPGNDLKSALPSTSGTMKGIVDNLECEDGMGERRECHSKATWNEDIDNVILKSCNEEECNKIDIDATGVKQESADMQCSNLGGLEARLALLQGRWNREEEFLTGTGSFIPDSPGRSDWNRAKEGVNGSPSRGLNDEQLGTNETSPPLTTHVLKQSEVLSTMDAAWNKGYHYVGSQYEGMESSEVEDKEAQSHFATQGHDSGLSIEARASIIRSRSCWADSNDRGDSGHEIFAGALDSGSSHLDTGISGVSKSEQSRVETVHDDGSDASLVSLGDSDIGYFQQAVAQSKSPIPERENEVECMLESASSDTEAVKSIIQSQDSEEESGWEHIRLPRQISK